ncbi:MAG: branched-chain-amino-acid transaminase [Candidatus Hodarchaeota archaeon]
MFGELVWINDKILRLEEARVPIVTATLHYGLGVFEGITAYPKDDNLYIFRLEDHVDRLFESARIYGMKIPYTKETLSKSVKELTKANKFHTRCYIRILVYRGGLPKFGVKQSFNAPVEVSIITSSRGSLIGTREFEKGKSAMISSWKRIAPDIMPPTAKSVANYANGALGLMEAQEKGVDYVVFLDHRGFVSEGSGQNIFIIKHGKIVTPPEYASILIGITRNTIIKLAHDLGHDVSEKDITRSQLYTAEEIFLCGTAAEIVPIVKVDGITVSEEAGSLTRKIAFNYKKLVTNKLPKYRNWITTVY